ncbi:hypothetical protein [Phytoactinopolyspora limicola]|uniref:hypothetical protein n=1 Tax=Phytoactinopolyspora limicola TaxID=2715536 RepID=UPI00140A0949|nr:hypothetical protein [Phytoactinopolyspora limicola]
MNTTIRGLGGHRCQPFAGQAGHSAAFALIYQRDPWCWEPSLGFHRSSAPTRPVELGVSRDKMVGPDAIHYHQALALGYGHGTSNDSYLDGISPFVYRFCEIGQRIRFTDPSPFAVFGRAARDYEWLRGAPPEQRHQVHRAVFRAAYQLMRPRPQGLHGWQDVLDYAARGNPASPTLQGWLEARSDEAWQERRTHTGYRELAAGHTLRGMVYGTNGGFSRGLVELYCLALPAERHAATWLSAVGSAIQDQVAATVG